MNTNNYCVYSFENLITSKIYFGVTNNVARRYREHISPKSRCLYLKGAIQKYGELAFYFTVEIEGLTLDEANQYEDFFVEVYDTINPEKGYNLKYGGGNKGSPNVATRKKIGEANKGKTRTEEHRRKLSEANKGKNNPNYGRTGELNHMYGKTHSLEARAKMSKANKTKVGALNNNAKKYIVTTPTGHEILLHGLLRQYCLNNSLSYSHMCSVAKGNRNHHKGYKVRYSEVLYRLN